MRTGIFERKEISLHRTKYRWCCNQNMYCYVRALGVKATFVNSLIIEHYTPTVDKDCVTTFNMGTCSSSNTNDNLVSDIEDIKKVKEANIDLNDNFEKVTCKESPVLKLLNGHYNLIFGPDPNRKMMKVEGNNVWMIGNDEEPEAITLEYGKV